MSALEAALRELRECAATGMTTGLLPHEITALTGHIDRLHTAVLAADERPEGWCVTVADAAAEARALVPARQDTAAETPALAVFRVGDVVEIVARDGETDATPPGLRLNGRTGAVAVVDPESVSEYSIGVAVEGWLGPVWCNPREIRHAATDESGAAR